MNAILYGLVGISSISSISSSGSSNNMYNDNKQLHQTTMIPLSSLSQSVSA
jgi:hypothetical protein